MEKFQGRQIDKDELQNKKAVEENVTENETVDFQARDDVKIVIIEDKDKTVQTDPSSLIKDTDPSADINSDLPEDEHLHEVSSINLSDLYSNEKFGHDLLQFIEHGQSLENWHHGSFSDTPVESFPPQMQMEYGVPIKRCTNADIQSTSESTVTLTVLNSTTSTDEAAQAISLSLSQPSTHSSNLVDHDYCTYPKLGGYSGFEPSIHAADNSALMQLEQHDLSMDQEKLLRMKRRKEKNRECSRQFRLKQKNKEQTLTRGRFEKAQELDSLKRNVEKLKATLSKVAQQCSSKCPKTRMLLSQYANVNKENINPDYMPLSK